MIERPSWIIEGVSTHVRSAADVVVYLDVPRSVCLRRALIRTVRVGTRTRSEMPSNCPEWRIVARLVRIIYRFPAVVGEALRSEANSDPAKFLIFRDPVEAGEVLAQLQLRADGRGSVDRHNESGRN